MSGKQKTTASAALRAKYGLSMQELANLCGKSRSTIMAWEYSNGCPAITRDLLQSIVEQDLPAEQMVKRLKRAFDKGTDTKSI